MAPGRPRTTPWRGSGPHGMLSRSRDRQLGLILLVAWATWLGLLVITRLADIDGPSAIDPLWYAGALLAVISVVALAAVGSRRWR